ncbi:metallophosphoesterase [Tepidibacter hydrothermalis]|uniref:Metallophosphoesterase n=1 Tax=Tepidibacter hydrothermalis TaxID=3036126 RepID=A0ABY8EFE3_9FIRM|nr:metallophosphoesterase [Tepidibacter hydrothermalis]WFD11657.1 metallophosphoesterase [Tepidibacter hydrothermalis]
MKKILVLILIILCSYIYYQVTDIKVNKVNIYSDKISNDSSIRILQISDIHNRNLNNTGLIHYIRESNIDMIVLTGDIIDAKTEDFEHIYSFLDSLISVNPNVYFVSGNHEWRNPNKDEFIASLKKKNLIDLNNSNKVFENDNTKINICGIDDPYSNHEDIYSAFENIDSNFFTILLSHSPNVILKYENIDSNLILCGHTHGGQIRLPIIGGLIAPGQGFFPKYDKGLYELDTDRSIYIDSGLGTSTLPIRFLNKSQISLIILQNKKND